MKLTPNFTAFRVISNISLRALFFILPCNLLNAQTYFFERYGVEQSLSSSKVYSVIQDKNDWIWLGTESGASRFDGSKFENFTSTNGMAGGGVFSLSQDTTGRVWFGHLNGGISIYDMGKFYKMSFDSITIGGDITGIRQMGKHLWITTIKDGAIFTEFPQRGDTLLKGRQYKGKDGLSDEVSGTCIDNNKNFYCITPSSGIKKFNPAKNIFETYLPKDLTKYFNTIYMYQDKKGNFWYGTYNGGLYKYDPIADNMHIYDVRDGLSKNMISYITEDYKGNVWVGTFGGGITVFEGDKMHIYDNSNGLEATSIHCILEDREKNMIIADHYTGISIYKGNHFKSWSDPAFLPDKNVFAIEQDELGRYWFGTNAGISVYAPGKEGEKEVLFFNELNSSVGNKIRFIKSDRKGNIWVGTEGSGLLRFDIKTKQFYYDIEINNAIYANYESRTITALAVDRKDRLWIGNMSWLIMWDGAKQEISSFSQANGLAGSWITTLFCDRDNNIWIGSDNKPGLTKYNASTGKFTQLKIGDEYVPQSIIQTPDDRIWVGTSSGLLVLKNDSVVMKLNEKNGLLSNNVKLLQLQGNKYLYIGTNYGLNRYNLADSTIASFTKRTGFQGIETKENASIADDKGNLWFGTTNGVTMLDPSLMPPIDTKPRVHLSSMEVNSALREMKPDLKLSYFDKTILFNYYSLSLTDPDAVRYKVMLKGYETDWKSASHLTTEDYSLLPGHYSFRVKASNSYGYWSEDPVEFSFIIKPPYYQSPLFMGGCLLFAVLGIISYIKIRERNLVREKKNLELKVVERTAEVVQKSVELEEKNRDITASIRYAERIQRAMLPRENIFEETFVLFMPKDIVSGDFYWMFENNDLQFIAACDCTGHGVPGAFMSIIGHNSLNKIVREYGITKPGAILDELNSEIVKALAQRQEETINDGMDLSLIAFNKKKFTLQYAGAYNPLYLVRKGKLFSYKGDRYPIGMSSLQIKKNFTNQDVGIQTGDMLYLCSDGYADQFGSVNGKKFKSGNVKKILTEIWHLPVNEQRSMLQKKILDWKGDLPQVDDIMFIGTRIPAL